MSGRPVCQAPFNSMYFNVFGEVGPCWLNLGGMGRYPENTIREIWFGEEFEQLREAIENKNLSYKCKTCLANIVDGNHHSVLAKLYDYPYPLVKYPTIMEFELSNRCNLECVMCKGDLSSTIRSNREKREPLVSPYDEAFVKQLEEFIPHLKEAKFLGGEPFLIEQYFSIWRNMVRLNPKINLTITTNGTVNNNRVKEVLNQLKINIIVSIDSFEEKTYEEIRKGGSFKRVMENFHDFRRYCNKAGTYFQVSMNPLRRNMWELNRYVDFCNAYGVRIWFNTVVYPHAESLAMLPHKKLKELYAFLSTNTLQERNRNCPSEVYNANVKTYRNLLENQLKVWMNKEEDAANSRMIKSRELDTSEMLEELKRDLLNYINQDAYVTSVQKHEKRQLIERKLTSLGNDGKDELDRLFVKNRSEMAEAWLNNKDY